jgi:hypothetical protein
LPTNIIRIDDELRAQRLQELTNVDNPTSILPEIAVLRLLEEEMLNQGNTGAVALIAKTIGQLCRNAEAAQIKRGEMLGKPIVQALAAKLAGLLASKVAGKFVGLEDVLTDIRRESQVLIVDARNDPLIEPK